MTRVFSWLKIRRTFLVKFIGISTAATAITFGIFSHLSSSSPTSPEDSLSAEAKGNIEMKNLGHRRLVAVLMLTRHGARTPLHIISGLEQAEYTPELLETYVKAKYALKTLDSQDMTDGLSKYDERNFNLKLKGGTGRGQLTSLGEKQMFELGRRIRKRYMQDMHFLSEKYNPNEIYSRSTHFRRTINSSKSVLAGIYLNSHLDSANSPFIINVGDLTHEYLFPNVLSCSYYGEALDFMQKLNLFKNPEYVSSLAALKQALRINDNNQDQDNVTYTTFRDDMSARKVHNLPVPEHLETFLEKSDRYASIELTSQHDFNLKLACGQLLNLLKNDLEKCAQVDTNLKEVPHKFKYYSAHDSTLNALLVAFNLINEDNHTWPPFAAEMLIELWKKPAANKYYVKVIYCGKELHPLGCGFNKENECELGDFVQVLAKNSIEKHEYIQMCSQKFTPDDKAA